MVGEYVTIERGEKKETYKVEIVQHVLGLAPYQAEVYAREIKWSEHFQEMVLDLLGDDRRIDESIRELEGT
jgi:hypothetical protein